MEEKRISINAFEKVMNDTYIPTETFIWNELEIVVKKTLTFKEMFEFVNDVVNTCFSEGENEHVPHVKEFMKRVCLVEKYTNLTLPKSTEKSYNLLYRTDVVEKILEHIDCVQYHEICNAIDEKINSTLKANIDAINRQIDQIFSSFNTLQEQMDAIFGNISQEDVTSLMKTLAENGGFDEKKIVDAYLDNKGAKQ